jgi:hypothetical protein
MILAVAVATECLSAGALEVQTGGIWYDEVTVEVFHCCWPEQSVDSVNIMDGDPMVLSSDTNKRSSYAFGESICDHRARVRPKGFSLLATVSTPLWPRLVIR